MDEKCVIGFDLGTKSVRTILINVRTGEVIAVSEWQYEHGSEGVISDPNNPHLARQHPADYVKGIELTVRDVLAKAKTARRNFSAQNVIGIGVATTGSTIIPVKRSGVPLAFEAEFANDPNAMAWLWKDHTSFEEAAQITATAEKLRPHYLKKYGGKYSSEWALAKIWNCLKVAPKVFHAAFTWVEAADWIAGLLAGKIGSPHLPRGICPSGHKWMYHPDWNGFPDEDFFAALDPQLVRIRQTLPDRAYMIGDTAGYLTQEWAQELGLPQGIPIGIGAYDAHLGAVGAGIEPGTMVMIIGTSTCIMMVAPLDQALPDIPGLCGIVPHSILPGHHGLEAGQSGVGDIFDWFVKFLQSCGATITFDELREQAAQIQPGQSGLLGLDWLNGNRTILNDQTLTGLILGMTLHTTPAETYRALIEATAFGARVIMERFLEYHLPVKRIITCGGIPLKDPLLMKIYANVLNRTMEISRPETCALGAAIAASVVAGSKNGGYDNFSQAQKYMTGVLATKYTPQPEWVGIYNRLYALYKDLHDAFGVQGTQIDLSAVMRKLLQIRNEVSPA